MKIAKLIVVGVALLAVSGPVGNAQQTPPQSSMAGRHKMDVQSYLASWKAKPKEAALKLIQKYGAPQEATVNRLIWHDKGGWKFTEIVNEEIAHDFPVPHVDFLYQAVPYRIDPKMADEVLSYDGSVILERTKGMLAARCDKEEPNFLAVNLAHDIITNKRNVDDARAFYAQSMMMLMKEGKPNDYQTGFKFQVASGDQGNKDTPAKMSSQ